MGDPKIQGFDGTNWAQDPSLVVAPVCQGNCHASPTELHKPKAFPFLSGTDPLKFGKPSFRSPAFFSDVSPWVKKDDSAPADPSPNKNSPAPVQETPNWAETKKEYYLQLGQEDEKKAARGWIQPQEKIQLLSDALRAYAKVGDKEKMKGVLQKLGTLYQTQKDEGGRLRAECQMALLGGDTKLANEKAEALERLADLESKDIPKRIERLQTALFFYQKLENGEKVRGVLKQIETLVTVQAGDFEKLAEKPGLKDEEKLQYLESAFGLYQRLGETKKAHEIHAKILPLTRKQGEQEEALAKGSTNPSQKITYLEAALTRYKFCQDEVAAKRVLGLIRGEYLKLKNDVGVTKVDAELAFLEGRLEEALKGYRALEAVFQNPDAKLSSEERLAALDEVNLKISLTLQALGAKEASAKHYDVALKYFEDALLRTPSEKLTDLTVAVSIQSGKGNLRAKQLNINALEAEIMRMKWPQKCGNCHTPNAPREDWKKELFESDSLMGFPTLPKKPKLDLSAYDDLKHLSKKEKEAIYWKDQDLKALKADYDKSKAQLTALVRNGLGPEVKGDARLLREEYLAKKLAIAGDPDAGIAVLKDLLVDLRDDSDPSRRAAIGHEIALIYHQKGLQELVTRGVTTLDFKDAVATLDTAYADLASLPAGQNKEFLQVQNRFLRAEILLSTANTPKEVEEATRVLKEILDQHPIYLQEDKGDNALQALMGRVELRLAQVYFSRKDTMDKGHCLAQDVIRLHPKDDYLVSQAMAARGLAKLQTSQAVEGLGILRQVQIQFPGTEAAEAIRTSPKLSSVRGADGILKENINEADIGEALKVALDRSGDTPAWRKMGLAGFGVLIAVILAPEITLPVLAVGAGGGLLADRALGVYEHRRDIGDAYRTGMSDVDMQRNLMNLFMLGLDVAMLFTAGAGGSVARGLTRAGLSRIALETSEVIARSELGVLERQGWRYAGKATMWALPRAADAATAYTIYKAEKSLILGEEFKWDPKEALLMFAMCESFALARELGVGAKLSTASKFSAGKLSPVAVEGKIIGFTNSAGKLVGWATDVTLGATGYYGLLAGIRVTGGELPGGLPAPDKFLMDQFVTLGALHLGAKAAGKVSGRVLDDALLKLDQKSNEWLKAAKENMEKGGSGGGGFSWGPTLAYAGAYGSSKVPEGKSGPMKNPSVMMMGKGEAEDFNWAPYPGAGDPHRSEGKKDFFGNKGAQNKEVQVITDLIEECLREEGLEIVVDAKFLRKIQEVLKSYKERVDSNSRGELPRDAYPEIAEEIAADLISSLKSQALRANGNDGAETSVVLEKPLSVREEATARIDAMIDEALGHQKSPISTKDPAAAQVRDVLRSRFLKGLELFLGEMPEIASLAELQSYGFFSGKKSAIIAYLAEVSRNPKVLEKDRAQMLADGNGTKTSSPTTPEQVKFDTSALHPVKQKEVSEWLGDRTLETLTETQQKELIQHLTQTKRWKRGDLQALIGVEGMRRFLGYGTELPFGFETAAQWKAFQKKLMEELAAGGIPIHDPRVKIVLQGSSVRGQSREGKGGGAFRWQGNPKEPFKKIRGPSDFDIAVIVDPSLFDTFLARRAKSILEKQGLVSTPESDLNLRRILKEKRLASSDQDAELQKHYQILRSLYGQRPIQISIMHPDCYLVPSPAEAMVISADILTGGN